MLLDEAVWDEIQRLYEETCITVAEMSRRFDVDRATINRRAKSGLWKPRPLSPSLAARRAASSIWHAKSLAAEAGPAAGESPKAPRQPDAPQLRITRLFRVIDLQLDKLETRMTSDQPLSAAEEARQTRAFGNILSNLEKATEAAAELAKTSERGKSGRNGETAKEAHANADDMRRQIADRLDRLTAQWNAQPKPE